MQIDLPIVGNWPGPVPLTVALGVASGLVTAPPLTQDELNLITAAAVEQVASVADTAVLDGIEFQLADLPGVQLGHALGSTVTIDVDAAGYGWFIDATAKKSVEFETVVSGTR